MTIIIVTSEDNESSEFQFDASQSAITLGRRSTNDVCISDLSVSGNHAVIRFENDQIILEDLNSTNGTYVNGQIIQSVKLHPDDEIIVGKILLQLIPEPAQSDAISDNTSEIDARDRAPVQPLRSVDETGREQRPGPALHTENARLSDHPAKEVYHEGDTATVVRPATAKTSADPSLRPQNESRATPKKAHPLDGLEHVVVPAAKEAEAPMHELDKVSVGSKGAVIEIRNGAKSGQILPIDKPVTTLGRPGIQIAAIMRKPDGYFLMHIESDDTIEKPTLNRDAIGDEPVLLHSGDELTVAGIDVAFMLS